jgi:hypothetical protein
MKQRNGWKHICVNGAIALFSNLEPLVRCWLLNKAVKELSHRAYLCGQFVDIPGFYTHIKKVSGHKFIYDLFIPITQAGQAGKKTVFRFPENVDVFNPASPAFYTVTFHDYPPVTIIGE